jgi:alkylation response protein AidB-like acyl-CoA dehydrogenase
MVVMEAFGRAWCSSPTSPRWSSRPPASASCRQRGAAEALLSAIAAGERMLALAHYEREARHKVSLVDTAAKQDGAGWKLSGGKGVVLGGAAADTLIVSANTGAKGLSLFLVGATRAGRRLRSYLTRTAAAPR